MLSHLDLPISTVCCRSAPRILVVDDDLRIAKSLRRTLLYEGYDVEVAHDGTTALEHIRSTPQDLVILDRMLPEMDGLEICRRIREVGDETSVLMLTARTAVEDRVEGLDAGADDYLVKPFAHPELLARVRMLLRRRSADADLTRLEFGPVSMEVESMEVTVDGASIELTALEFRLLHYFLLNPRVVLSRSQILIAVWGLDADTSSNIVDVYVRYLRQKTEVDGNPRLIQTVRGAGYSLKDPR